MLSNKTWVRIALAANLVGTVVLFYSFQATSSRFSIVTQDNGPRVALCVNELSLLNVQEDKGIMLGGKCPTWANNRPAAVVNIERPWLVTVGFILSFLGFAIQFASTPSPQTERQLRLEIKRLREESQQHKKT